MKILAQTTPGCLYSGFKKCAEKSGHKWIWWDIKHTPAFQVFKDINPDMFISCYSQADNKDIDRCLRYFNPKIVMIQNGNKFDFGINGIGLSYPILFDTNTNYGRPPLSYMECDLASVGEEDAFVQNLCYPIGKYNIKVFGPQKWSVPQYMGTLSYEGKLSLFNSAKAIFSNKLEDIAIALQIGKACFSILKDLPCNCNIFDDIKQLELQFSTFMNYERFVRIDKQYIEEYSYEKAWKDIELSCG